MADSKEELMMQDLKTKLEAITLANGYDNEVKSVQRFEMIEQTFVEQPVIILGFAGIEHKSRVNPNIVWEMATILIAAYIKHDKTDDTRSTDAILVSLDADIYKAVMQDRTLGGLAKDLSRVSVFPDDQQVPIPYVAHVSEFAVQYTHLIDTAIN